MPSSCTVLGPSKSADEKNGFANDATIHLRRRGAVPLCRHRAHLAAAPGASAAGRDAFVHVADLFATVGARGTDRRARGADVRVHRRLPQQKIGAGCTDLRAVEHQPVVLRIDMLAARFQAMCREHAQANCVATLTMLEAYFHCLFVHKIFRSRFRFAFSPGEC